MAPTAQQPDDLPEKLTIVQEISSSLQRRLESESSPLVYDPAVWAELERQVAFILGDVLARTGSGEHSGDTGVGNPRGAGDTGDSRLPAHSGMEPAGEAKLFSVEVGASRARRGIHPVESLRAATVLFEVALPVLVTRFAAHSPARALSIGLALHEAIMERVALASLSYVDFLLEKLQASRQEERRRIARELHDRVSHGMGLALQNLDLHKHYAERDPQRGQEKLTAAVGALGEALHTVQQMSAELRRSVGTDGIERALQAYVRANVPSTVRTAIEFTGDLKTLPPNVSEELYLILREAVRNALRHAAATELLLRVEITESLVSAEVADNGSGFEARVTAMAPGGGLLSMAERAQLLRGTLDLESESGRGTRVILSVPLTGGAR